MSELPKGWTHAALGDLAEFTNGKAFKKGEWLETGKPIIRIQNLNNKNAPFNYADDSHEERFLVRKGDLLVSWSASLGVYFWHGDDAWLNQHIFRVHSLLGCDKGFLKYAIEISIDDFYAKAHGMGMVHITKGNFESHLVPLPPLGEQTRIATKLDELLAQVDTLKARIDGIPALLKRFRQSVLAAAVSGQLTRSCDGIDLPFNWQQIPFSTVINDLRYGTAQKCDYGAGSVGVLRIPNIGENGIKIDDLKSSDFTETEIAKLSLQKGDVVLIRSNGSVELVGKSAVISDKEEGLLFAGYLIRVRLDTKKALPEYVNFWLKSPSTRQVIEVTARSTSGVNNINSEEIKSLMLTLPTLAEQTEIVHRVEQLFAFADQLEAKVNEAQARIDRLTQSILAKAFRGELVPQDPNDEPASELLARIQAQRASAPKAKRGRRKVES